MNYVEKVFQSIAVGDGISWTKTITESDVYLFAGITGDLGSNHINEEYMRNTEYGKRIAQGVLILGLSSATVWMFANRFDVTGASLGYDKVRFVKPVMLGDTVTIDYRRRVRSCSRADRFRCVGAQPARRHRAVGTAYSQGHSGSGRGLTFRHRCAAS